MKRLFALILLLLPLTAFISKYGLADEKEWPKAQFLIDGKPSTSCNCNDPFKVLAIEIPLEGLDDFYALKLELKGFDKDVTSYDKSLDKEVEQASIPTIKIKELEAFKGKKSMIIPIVSDVKSEFEFSFTKLFRKGTRKDTRAYRHFLTKDDICHHKKNEPITLNMLVTGHVILEKNYEHDKRNYARKYHLLDIGEELCSPALKVARSKKFPLTRDGLAKKLKRITMAKIIY